MKTEDLQNKIDEDIGSLILRTGLSTSVCKRAYAATGDIETSIKVLKQTGNNEELLDLVLNIMRPSGITLTKEDLLQLYPKQDNRRK